MEIKNSNGSDKLRKIIVLFSRESIWTSLPQYLLESLKYWGLRAEKSTVVKKTASTPVIASFIGGWWSAQLRFNRKTLTLTFWRKPDSAKSKVDRGPQKKSISRRGLYVKLQLYWFMSLIFIMRLRFRDYLHSIILWRCLALNELGLEEASLISLCLFYCCTRGLSVR